MPKLFAPKSYVPRTSRRGFHSAPIGEGSNSLAPRAKNPSAPPVSMGGFYDQQNARQAAELKNSAEDDKQNERKMVERALRGGYSNQDMLSALSSSTTGYSDPAVDKFSKNPITADTYQKIAMQKAKPFTSRGGGANQGDKTADLLTFLSTYDANKKVPTGGMLPASKATGFMPVKETRLPGPADALNSGVVKARFKGANFNDPRVVKALQARFPEPPPSEPPPPPPPAPAPEAPQPGFMDRMKNLFAKAPDTAQPPGATRVFTDSGGLPNPQGVAEGSYLKSNGVRTHQLKGGQWQPIQ